MKRIATSGPFMYAIAMIAFGLEHFAFDNFPPGLLPVSPAVSGRTFWVHCLGAAFVAAGAGLLIRQTAKTTATLLGGLWLLLLLVAQVPRLAANPSNPSAWTGALEVVALGGGAFILTGLLPFRASESPLLGKLPGLGRYLFAFSLAFFGVQHLMYANFIATLITAWIPGKLFWAYFVGIAFLATSVSLFWGRQVRLSTILLGSMFLLWVLLLHGPRVAAAPQVEPEWTSTFVALAMSGIALTLAGYEDKRELVSTKAHQLS